MEENATLEHPPSHPNNRIKKQMHSNLKGDLLGMVVQSSWYCFEVEDSLEAKAFDRYARVMEYPIHRHYV